MRLVHATPRSLTHFALSDMSESGSMLHHFLTRGPTLHRGTATALPDFSPPPSLFYPGRKEAQRTCGAICSRTRSSPGCPTKSISSTGNLVGERRPTRRVQKKITRYHPATPLARSGFNAPLQVPEISISRSSSVIPHITTCLADAEYIPFNATGVLPSEQRQKWYVQNTYHALLP